MKLRKFIFILLSAAIMIALPAVTAYAASEIQLNAPAEADVGENFEVSLDFYASEIIGSVQTSVIYDPETVEFVSGDMAYGSGGAVTVQGSVTDGSDKLSVSLIFKCIAAGSAELYTENSVIYSQEQELIGSPATAYANVEVFSLPETTSETAERTDSVTDTPQEPQASESYSGDGMPTQGVLTSLTVDHGTLTPDFKYDIYDYTVNVDYSVDNVEIEGVTASINDYIWYEGVSECSVGSNVRKITVTDVDGNSVTYTVTIVRAEQGETVTELQEGSSQPKKVKNSSSESSLKASNGIDRYKQVLNPALAIVLVVLIVALIAVIIWIRGRFSEMKKR
ncbi:MAG: cadherin-like beta sandwich domain-containing protein [Ruminococcus sp.]|nr:cadherin-like beta sandwich domain-containing protein [Ruminococcus sp.]